MKGSLNDLEQRIVRYLCEEFRAKGNKPLTMLDPATTHVDVMEKFGLDHPQYRMVIAKLERLGIVQAIAVGRSYGHLRINPEIVDIVNSLDEMDGRKDPGQIQLAVTTPPEAIWLGNGRIQIGDETISLELQYAKVLQALVELRAATKAQLQDRSGKNDPGKVLQRLVERFPSLQPYITFPGRRGKGGYRTIINDGSNTN